MVVTCQSQDNHALLHTLLYYLLYSKWDHHLQNEHNSVLKKTMNSLRNY